MALIALCAAVGYGQESAAIVPIHGEIDRSQVVFVSRSIAVPEDTRVVVFDIDTFGGRVDSALQITTLIGSLKEVETVAYVRVSPEGTGVSWSAGALIAMACDSIYMAPGTSIGAAAPVIPSADGSSQDPGEKTVSAIRTQMAALAEKNGYSRGIALAMVDADVELVEVYINGTLTVMTSTEYESVERDAEEDGRSIRKGEIVSPVGKLLSLTAGEMERYGVSSGSPVSFEELYRLLMVDDGYLVERSQADRFVSFLTGGAMTSLLIIAGLIALFIEITSPGFGLPGSIALFCFAVIFGSNFLLGRVGSVELLLFLLGIVLLIIEIFLIPGFGVVGISGIALIAASLLLAQQDFTLPQFEWQWQNFNQNALIVLGSMVGALAVFVLAAPLTRNPFIFKQLALTHTQDPKLGYTVQGSKERRQYLGQRGATITTLRPAGKVSIDGRPVDAVSEGDFIEAGVEIEIIRVEGNRIVVMRAASKEV